jgi:periplasmic protein TonB
MRMNHGTDTPTRNADLNSPPGRFSTRLLMHRANKLQDIVSNLKELFTFHPVKFAGNVPLAQSTWAADKNMGPSQIVSFAVHGGLVLLILIPFITQLPHPSVFPPGMRAVYAPDLHELRAYLFPPSAPQNGGGGGGGGGERNPIPESIGRRPDLSLGPQIIPPSVRQNEKAILQLRTTLEGRENPQIPNLDMNRWGNPRSDALTDSNGPGKGHGIGKGDGNGVGDGKGLGFDDGEKSGFGGNKPSVPGNGVTFPTCQYCPRPDYSDEARKVKYSGSVWLNVVVLPSGKTGRVEMVTSLGMGLDEKAVEAVRGWMFKPGVGPNGKPVATIVTIEVIFQLF